MNVVDQAIEDKTSLHRNPFFILGASTRDNQGRLIELEEDRALALDPDVCQKARSVLVSPRNRLSAEIGWLPGASPRKAEQVMAGLLTSQRFPVPVQELSPLARANVLAARMEDQRLDEVNRALLSDFSRAIGEIDVDEVMRDLNEDRLLAGIPPVNSVDFLESELAAQRRYFRDVARELLDRLSTEDVIKTVSALVSTDTKNGERHPSPFIGDIVDAYETGAQAFVEAEEKTVKKLVSRIRGEVPNGESSLTGLVTILARILSNWNKVIGPIQMACKAKGIDHPASREIAIEVRALSLYLNNDHSMIDACKTITDTLRREFSFLPEFAERVSEDAQVLSENKAARDSARKQAEENKAEFTRSVTFTADVGAILKNRLEISPDGIVWKGRRFRLEEIKCVRWGGTRHSVNGVPTGTTYEIYVGTPKTGSVINLRNSDTYSRFVACLWRGVCVRLIFEIADVLRNGGSIVMGEAVLEDTAVTLVRHNAFRANEKVRLEWHQVQLWNANGSMVLGMQGDKKVFANMSYTTVDNTHVVEYMIREKFKTGDRKLSSVAPIQL